MTVKFKSNAYSWDIDLGRLAEETIRQMPMLYRADLAFALHTVPSLWNFAKALPVNPYAYKYQSLDVKVTMLKKGWYPCIPGWHCDDFYRPTGEQPDHVNLHEHNSTHFMAVFGDSSLTEFMNLGHVLHLPEKIPEGETLYGFCNRAIKEEEEGFRPMRFSVRPNSLYEFDSMTFHRGMPATQDGWRAFVRLTLGSERAPKNEIRSQVQVYVPTNELEAGW